jgi:hypothetical protein
MIRKTLKGIFVLGIAGILWGCYPEGPEYYQDYDVVYTNYDNQYTFTNHKNYAIPDRIVKITDALIGGGIPEFVNPAYSVGMIDRIKANMSSLGYSLVSDTTTADLILMPSAIEATNLTYYYDYWWYYWGYGWGYYYPYPITYSYKTGSLFMNLIDRKDISPDNKRRIVWTGIVNGLLEGSATDFTSRMNQSINQAFAQSPYLHQ